MDINANKPEVRADDVTTTPTTEVSDVTGDSDRGYRWLVVLAAFVTSFFIEGTSYSFGVVLLEFLEEFDQSRASTAAIGSIRIGCLYLITLFAGPVSDRLGRRVVCMIGALLSATGVLASSFADSVELLYLTYGVIGGCGFGMMMVSANASVLEYFTDKRAFAIGLALSGSGVGTFTMNPLIRALIREFTWRGSLLILSGLLLNGVACGLILVPPRRRAVDRDHEVIVHVIDTCNNNQTDSACVCQNAVPKALTCQNGVPQTCASTRQDACQNGVPQTIACQNGVPETNTSTRQDPCQNDVPHSLSCQESDSCHNNQTNGVCACQNGVPQTVISTRQDACQNGVPQTLTCQNGVSVVSQTVATFSQESVVCSHNQNNGTCACQIGVSLSSTSSRQNDVPKTLICQNGVSALSQTVTTLSQKSEHSNSNAAISDSVETVRFSSNQDTGIQRDTNVNIRECCEKEPATSIQAKRDTADLNECTCTDISLKDNKSGILEELKIENIPIANGVDDTHVWINRETPCAELHENIKLAVSDTSPETQRRDTCQSYVTVNSVRHNVGVAPANHHQDTGNSDENVNSIRNNVGVTPEGCNFSLAKPPDSETLPANHHQDTGNSDVKVKKSVRHDVGVTPKGRNCSLAKLQLRPSEITPTQRPTLLRQYLDLLSDVRCSSILVSAFFFGLVFYIPFSLLPDQVAEDGVGKEEAAWLLSSIGITNTISRIVFGFLGDRKCVNKRAQVALLLCMLGVVMAASLLLQTFPTKLVFTAVFGVLFGGIICTFPALLASELGVENIGKTYSMYYFCNGLALSVATPIAGWTIDVTRGYTACFLIAGCEGIIASVVLIVPFIRKCCASS